MSPLDTLAGRLPDGAVIARGRGSGVCGAAQADHGSVVLDLSRMDRIGPVAARPGRELQHQPMPAQPLGEAPRRHEGMRGHRRGALGRIPGAAQDGMAPEGASYI